VQSHAAVDMNNRGIVLLNGSGRVFIYDIDTEHLTELAAVPNARTFARAINDAGDAVGVAFTPNPGEVGSSQLVLWARDTLAMTTAPVAAGNRLEVTGINDQGNIVGSLTPPSSFGSAVFWPSLTAAPHILPAPVPPAGTLLMGSSASGVNDAGWVVGNTTIAAIGNDIAERLGVAWTPDRRTIELGRNTTAAAMNATGVIVGSSNHRAARFDLAQP
jgi:uncharacterized membrane protein